MSYIAKDTLTKKIVTKELKNYLTNNHIIIYYIIK